MLTRRRILRDSGAAAATLAAAGTAGCLFDGAEEGPTLLSDVANTRPAIQPTFQTAYTCDPAALTDALGGDEALPAVAGRLLANVEANVVGTVVDDLDRLTGQYGQLGGHSGGDVRFVPATASQVLLSGEIAAAGANTWLDDLEATTNLGPDRGYDRYGTSDEYVEAFVVDDAHLGFGNRRGLDVEPADVATDAIDAVESEAPAREYLADLGALADVAGGDTITVGTQFDLVAERPDTGTAAYDDVAASLLAAGATATLDGEDEEEATVERLLHYRRERVPEVETVEAALEAATDEDAPLAGADWSVRRQDRTVVASATVPVADLADAPTALRTAFPIPALEDVTTPIDPRTLGREPPPRVSWQPSLAEDGRLLVDHGGGAEVEDLLLRYDHQGEQREEAEQGPVTDGDRLATAEPVDAGSLFELVWAPDTSNETILLRVQIPE